MNDEQLELFLIEALAALETGQTVEQILSRYPAQADQLRPMLRAAVRLTTHGQATSRATPTLQRKSRAAFLSQAAESRPQTAKASPLVRLAHSRIVLSFLAVLMLAFVIGASVLGASAASLPGDPLYGVKRSVENVQLSFAPNSLQRVSLQETYTERRAEEVKAVQAARRAVQVDFTGLIQVMSATEWTVDGFVVQVTPNTVIDGSAQVQDLVEVVGHTLPDGGLVAERIEDEDVDVAGVVEAMKGQVWSIGGKRVLVTQETHITGTARLNAKVKLHARRFPDSTLLARTIEFDDHDLPLPDNATRTPTPHIEPKVGATPQSKSVEPTADATPHPRETESPGQPLEPTADATARPAETRESGRTPEPTTTREPNRTPEPIATREPSQTPEPTGTHESLHTPEPTLKPDPTQTPGLTRTPIAPGSTSEPTELPQPTQAPQPTDKPRPTQSPEPHDPTETPHP